VENPAGKIAGNEHTYIEPPARVKELYSWPGKDY
jgi:hypothetical protein